MKGLERTAKREGNYGSGRALDFVTKNVTPLPNKTYPALS
jgi:hypothetical protein